MVSTLRAMARALPRRVDAHGGEAVCGCFLAEFFDVVVGGFGFEQRVIYEARPFTRRACLAQHEADARRACVDDAVHALGAAMEALGRAAAHRGLVRAAVAVQARDDRVGDLVNQ